MEDIVRKCNPILNLLKFISNKKILSEVIVICCNQVCNQTLSIRQLMQERERERERERENASHKVISWNKSLDCVKHRKFNIIFSTFLYIYFHLNIKFNNYGSY